MDSFSQFGEDKFILNLFKKKNISQGTFVEFGAWDGIHLSNCKLLADNQWSGYFIEGDPVRCESCKHNYRDNKKIIVINKFINTEYTLNHFINEYKINNIDVLSIDIDGKDLTELKKLNLIKPKIIIIEFNSTIPLDTECEDIHGGNGSSYLSIKKYLKFNNYELIHVTNCNLIFTNKNFNQEEFNNLSDEEVMKTLNPIRIGFNNFGEMFFIEHKKIIKKEYFKFPTMKSFVVFQPVPKFIRKLTDIDGKNFKLLKIIYSNMMLLLLRPNLLLRKFF